MVRLHTEWTVDWAVRLVAPLELWIEAKWPFVTKARLQEQERRRHTADLRAFLQEERARHLEEEIDDLVARMTPRLPDLSSELSAPAMRELRVRVEPSSYSRVLEIDFPYGVVELGPHIRHHLIELTAKEFARKVKVSLEKAFAKGRSLDFRSREVPAELRIQGLSIQPFNAGVDERGVYFHRGPEIQDRRPEVFRHR
jgi:hypothetical protein